MQRPHQLDRFELRVRRMPINAIWTAFCDGPTDHMGTDAYGLPESKEWAFLTDSKAECVKQIKRNGWSIHRGVVLCPKCVAARL